MKTRSHLRALFVLSVVTPMAAFIANSVERYRDVWVQAEQQADAIVEVLQEHALKVLETQELVLDLVEDIIADTPASDLGAQEASARLVGLGQRLRQTVSIWIADAEGAVLASSVAWAPGLNVSHLEYFQAQRDQDRPHFISERYVGRMTSEPSFALSRRRTAPDGSFAGTIHVAISPIYFEEFFGRTVPEAAGAAALIRADGRILARHPVTDTPHQLGPGSPLLRALTNMPNAGRIEAISTLDGVRRVYAFRRLGEFEVYVGYGADMPAALAAWRANFLLRSLGALTLVFLLCSTIWLISRSLTDRQQALERLRAESQLREEMQHRLQEGRSLEALGRMARGVAHDFNNMLTVVIGNLEALGQKATDKESLRALDGARRAATEGAQLAASLLAYARNQVLQTELFQVEPFLRGVVPLLQEIATASRPIRLEILPDLPGCCADLAQLRACLSNLVANARDATEAGGELVLGARLVHLDAEALSGNWTARPGSFVAISLTDTGIGMTGETAARAFEPFFTSKADGAGSGLGLSQVFGLMRQLDGHVVIRSAPGEGATVTLFLPAIAADAQAMPQEPPVSSASDTPEEPPPAPRPGGARILVVDDQPEVRGVVETMLRSAGFFVVAVEGPAEALRVLEEDSTMDLVLSDVVMPGGMDGISLVRELRRKHPRLRMLLMSGYAPGIEALGSLEVGVVSKPFTRKTLVAAVRGALATTGV